MGSARKAAGQWPGWRAAPAPHCQARQVQARCDDPSRPKRPPRLSGDSTNAPNARQAISQAQRHGRGRSRAVCRTLGLLYADMMLCAVRWGCTYSQLPSNVRSKENAVCRCNGRAIVAHRHGQAAGQRPGPDGEVSVSARACTGGLPCRGVIADQRSCSIRPPGAYYALRLGWEGKGRGRGGRESGQQATRSVREGGAMVQRRGGERGEHPDAGNRRQAGHRPSGDGGDVPAAGRGASSLMRADIAAQSRPGRQSGGAPASPRAMGQAQTDSTYRTRPVKPGG